MSICQAGLAIKTNAMFSHIIRLAWRFSISGGIRQVHRISEHTSEKKSVTQRYILFLSMPLPAVTVRLCLSSLANGAFHVFGQLEYFNRRDELLLRELIIVNAERHEKSTDFLLIAASLKVHCFLQLPLDIGCG